MQRSIAFQSTNVALKDKSDVSPRGFTGPRKVMTKEAGPKKEKTEEEKDKRKQERLEREVSRHAALPCAC